MDLTKEYFVNTRWDVSDWSDAQKTRWQEYMFGLGFSWENSKDISNLNKDYYIITEDHEISYRDTYDSYIADHTLKEYLYKDILITLLLTNIEKDKGENNMIIETISYLKKNASNLSLEDQTVITQNGTPSYVIESYVERKRQDEAVALLKLLSFSVDDVNNNRVMSISSLKQHLANRKLELESIRHKKR